MLAVGGDPEPPLHGKGLLFEPKYDGIRAIVEVTGGPSTRVRFWSRNGNEKTNQFPEIAAALEQWSRNLNEAVILDGEIIALDASGRPLGFQALQHRINVRAPGYQSRKPILPPDRQPAALVLFDLLVHGSADLRLRPLSERRAALERLLANHPVPDAGPLRLSVQVADDGRPLFEQAEREGWEGLLVKVARSPYRTGRRSPEWRKLKLQNVDDFIVCGYTSPQGTRARFGALVLGAVAENGWHGTRKGSTRRLEYAGDVGTGFTHQELERLWTLLEPLRSTVSPFNDTPASLARRTHWVRPELIVQVRYAEKTDEGRLRHPAYLGVRDDKDVEIPRAATPASRSTSGTAARSSPTRRKPARDSSPGAPPVPLSAGFPGPDEATALIEQLDALESTGKDGRLVLPDGDTLDITNLQKVFWPDSGRTKGDLLRYYVRVAPVILPVVDNRPLVMKRLPNGVAGKAFYQHRAPEPVPAGVRIETLPDDDVPARLVGGSLKTLLYMAQLASISMDPFFSTMDALSMPDQVAIDLDPQPGATFGNVVDVARWVHEVLEHAGVASYPKTSGSEGIHIFIPLPPDTPYDAGMLFCQIVATLVATQHPKVATVERTVRKRRVGTVYVDYLQNIEGKTLACAYSARASAFAGVSAPLAWEEVYESLSPEQFTIDTMPARLTEKGDLWAPLRQARGTDLLAAIGRLGGSPEDADD